MDNKTKEKLEADCPRCGWIEPWDNDCILACDCHSEPIIINGKKPIDKFMEEKDGKKD